MAEAAEAAATQRKRTIRDEARLHLQVKAHAQLPWYNRWFTDPRDLPIEQRLLDVVTNTWAAADPIWAGHVADNRWYLMKATAYGAGK
jgi:hypothetical protein